MGVTNILILFMIGFGENFGKDIIPRSMSDRIFHEKLNRRSFAKKDVIASVPQSK